MDRDRSATVRDACERAAAAMHRGDSATALRHYEYAALCCTVRRGTAAFPPPPMPASAPSGWIERLAAAAYSAPDVGTATPLSNDATIFSYPLEDGPNPVPDEAAAMGLDRRARRGVAAAVA